jgi:signal peptidase II
MRFRLLALLGILLPTVACDQATKAMAVADLKGAGMSQHFGGLVRLVYAENPGAFLGLGRDLPDEVRLVIFSMAVAIALLAGVVFIAKTPLGRVAVVGAALLVAGGVGNLVDRVFRPGHRVVDFMQLRAGPLQTGIFNVADIAIMVGAGMVMVGTWRRRKDTPERDIDPVPVQ